MTTRETWKNLERKVAKILGGQRIPCSGVSGGRLRGDVLHNKFFVETKLRNRLSIWSMFEEVKFKAKKQGEGKTPLLVVKEKGRKGELVILELEDFTELYRIYV